MKNNKKNILLPLYAIYKNGGHLGNERAASEDEAIKNYLIASELEYFLNDKEFVSKYFAKPAIKNIHY